LGTGGMATQDFFYAFLPFEAVQKKNRRFEKPETSCRRRGSFIRSSTKSVKGRGRVGWGLRLGEKGRKSKKKFFK